MSASTESQDQAVGVSERPPSDKQLRYLRSLVLQRGESFGYPRTSAEASAEINRLKQRRPSSFTERRIEREQVSRDMVRRGDGASVRDSEIVGYGSQCRWLHQTRS